MRIGGLQKLTLVDYPGKLACTIFFSGCSFRCPWCYNQELVLPEKIREQAQIAPEGVLGFLKKRQGELEGVVLCGGEPTLYPELVDFCKDVKALGYLVKLDTNGFNPEMLKKLIKQGLVDYVAMDVKASKEKYFRAIGGNTFFKGFDAGRNRFWGDEILQRVEASVEFLRKGLVEFEFRTTVVPGLLTQNDIMKIVRWISPAQKYVLQEFRLSDDAPLHMRGHLHEDGYLYNLVKAAEPFFEVCELRRAASSPP